MSASVAACAADHARRSRASPSAIRGLFHPQHAARMPHRRQDRGGGERDPSILARMMRESGTRSNPDIGNFPDEVQIVLGGRAVRVRAAE
jgi:hypothetical protein